MADPKSPTRDQLAKFLPDQDAIRRFERLFDMVGNITPNDILILYRLAQEVQIDAGTADAKANAAITASDIQGQLVQRLLLAPPASPDPFASVDYVDFPTLTPSQIQARRVLWNSDTVDVGLLNSVTLKAGQQDYVYVRNGSGVTISKGRSVMVTGSINAPDRLAVALAEVDGTISANRMLGIAAQDIISGADGYIIRNGPLSGFDTTGTPYGEAWVDGDLLYLNATTDGGLTKVKPTATALQFSIGTVLDSASGGSIQVQMKVSEPAVTPGTTSQYWRGDKTFQSFSALLTSLLITSPTAAVGYGTGAGGTVTQATSKATTVTLDKPCGRVIMNGALLAAGAIVSFVINNTQVAVTDTIIINISGGVGGFSSNYNVWATPSGTAIFVSLQNISLVPLSEAVELNFSVIKAVIA